MRFEVKFRQYFSFAVLAVMLCAATPFLYRQQHREWVAFRAAEDRFFRGEFSAAAPLYVQAIGGGVKAPEALFRLGDSYLGSRAFDDAARIFKMILDKYPDSLRARYKLAELLAMSGRLDEALALLDARAADQLRGSSLLILKARVLGYAGRYEQAIELYKQYLGESP